MEAVLYSKITCVENLISTADMHQVVLFYVVLWGRSTLAPRSGGPFALDELLEHICNVDFLERNPVQAPRGSLTL